MSGHCSRQVLLLRCPVAAPQVPTDKASAPAGNSISGSLPADLAQCTALTFLSLKVNALEGTLPAAYLSQLRSLAYISLSYNQLGGTIPPLGNLTQLAGYDLSHNALTGVLPEDWLASRQLRVVDVSHNLLRGSLPGALAGSDLYGADCTPPPWAFRSCACTTCCLAPAAPGSQAAAAAAAAAVVLLALAGSLPS